MALLSIITINFNNAEGLQKTIESVVTQENVNNSDIEYLIIDGNSTDESVNIIKKYAENSKYNNRIAYWVSEPDNGIYNAMNKGIQKASGEYVYMLNSGDYLEPNSLLKIIDKLISDKPDLLLFSVKMWNHNVIQKIELRTPDFLNESTMIHQGMIYLKKIHDKIGLYDENYKFASDYDFTIRAFYKKDINISKLYTPISNFIFGGVGSSSESALEFNQLQIKHNFALPPKKINPIKKVIKLFVPFGIIKLIQYIKCRKH